MDTQPKCEEIIDGKLKDRLQDIENVLKADDVIGAFDELILALSKTVIYKLELSYGGPQDYFEFEYDPVSKQLIEVRYHYLDWFDHAERRITPVEREEFKLLERLFETCIEGVVTED